MPIIRADRSCAAATARPPPGTTNRGHRNDPPPPERTPHPGPLPASGAREKQMTGNMIETVMGAVVLAVAAFFLFFAYTTSQVRAVQGYQVTAQFDSVAGIRDGSDVRIAGVKVGSILSETLDPKTFLADLHLSIDP